MKTQKIGLTNMEDKTERQVVVGVCTNRDGEFLLAKRLPDDSYGDLWEFPGGGVENESQRSALRREWKEELGVDIKVLRKLCSLYGLPLKNSQFNLHVYAVKLLPRNKPQPLESQEVRWLKEEEIYSLTRQSCVDILVKIYKMFYQK